MASDSWYYIDNSGVEQGPHPLAHMRYWLEHGQIPGDTKVKDETSTPFKRADKWSEITDGITVPPLPVKPSDEAAASEQMRASVTKGRAKRAARPPSSPKKTRARPAFLVDDVSSPRGAAPAAPTGSLMVWLVVPAVLAAAVGMVAAALCPDLLHGLLLKTEQ